MAKQRHDLGLQKRLASKPAREAAERRRLRVKKLARRKKRRAQLAGVE